MDKFIRDKNIELFRRELAQSADPAKRALLKRLLAEQLAKGHSPKRAASRDDGKESQQERNFGRSKDP